MLQTVCESISKNNQYKTTSQSKGRLLREGRTETGNRYWYKQSGTFGD